MQPVSCTITHRHAIDLVNHRVFKIQKLGYLENGTKLSTK